MKTLRLAVVNARLLLGAYPYIPDHGGEADFLHHQQLKSAPEMGAIMKGK